MKNGSNMPEVTIAEFTKVIRMQLQEKNYRPVFGLGKGGIGKTESIMELAKDLAIGYIDIRLLLYSETDLKGIPYPNEQHTKTIWLQNNILPTKEKDGEKGILVFDEITSCARSVRTAAYQLLNERKLGEYILPDDWIIVCLGNGEEDGGDFNGMEANFANRCSVYNVVEDVDAWLDWAAKPHGEHQEPVNELVTAYIRYRRSALHTFNPEDERNLLFASPRSWKAVSDILNDVKRYEPEFYSQIFADDKDERNRILKCRIEANIGDNTAPDFFVLCSRRSNLIDPMEIINGTEEGMNFTPQDLFDTAIVIDTVRGYLAPRICAELKGDKSDDYNKIPEKVCSGSIHFFTWLCGLTNEEFKVMGYKDFLRYDSKKLMRFLLENDRMAAFIGQNENFRKFVESPVFR